MAVHNTEHGAHDSSLNIEFIRFLNSILRGNSVFFKMMLADSHCMGPSINHIEKSKSFFVEQRNISLK